MRLRTIITSDNKIPDEIHWGETLMLYQRIDEYNRAFDENLYNLSKKYKLKVELSDTNVYDVQWNTHVDYYPLRQLICEYNDPRVVAVGTREKLSYYEIYASIILPAYTQMIHAHIHAKNKTRIGQDAILPHDIHLCSIHINCTHVPMEFILRETLNNTKIHTKWDYVVTSAQCNNANKWQGVDGTHQLTSANLRAWKNRAAINFKCSNIILVNDENTVNSIIFCLTTLHRGGAAVIYLKQLSTMSRISMIHLFSLCFEISEICHTIADDRIYLCGTNFKGNITNEITKKLLSFGESASDNMSCFTIDYINSEIFTHTMNTLITINNNIIVWRQTYYEKILKSCGDTASCVSNNPNENFVDLSEEWLKYNKITIADLKI